MQEWRVILTTWQETALTSCFAEAQRSLDGRGVEGNVTCTSSIIHPTPINCKRLEVELSLTQLKA